MLSLVPISLTRRRNPGTLDRDSPHLRFSEKKEGGERSPPPSRTSNHFLAGFFALRGLRAGFFAGSSSTSSWSCSSSEP